MNSDQTYTIYDYLAAFHRRRRLLLVVAVPILLIAGAFALLLPDQYASSSRIEIDLDGADETLEPIELTRYADQYIAKLSDRVLTGSNFETLASDASVFSGMEELPDPDERINLISESINVSVVTQPVLSPNGGREVDVISGFRVTAVGPDPVLAYRVASHIAEKFLEADRLSRTEIASSTSGFLRDQMDTVESEIVELEAEIANFKVANECCLPELMTLNQSVIQRTERDIETLQPRIRTLATEQKFLQAQMEEIRQQSTGTDRLGELEEEYLRLVANYGPDHPDVGRVKREILAITSASATGDSQIVELRLKLAEAEQKYSDQHPDVIRYKREVALLEARRGTISSTEQALLDNPRFQQLRSELNSLNIELEELTTRVPSLRGKINEYESRLRRTPQIESQYRALNRKLETARDNFINLQERLVIARQTEALESTEIGARLTEVRPAKISETPSGPPRVAVVIIGAFLAAALGFGMMLLGELTDTHVRGSKDVAVVLDVVPLAVIPIMESTTAVATARQRFYLIFSVSILVAVAIALYVLNSGT